MESSESPVTCCVTLDTRDLFCRGAEIMSWGTQRLQSLAVSCKTSVTRSAVVPIQRQWRAPSLQSLAVSRQAAVTRSAMIQIKTLWGAPSLQLLAVSHRIPGVWFAESSGSFEFPDADCSTLDSGSHTYRRNSEDSEAPVTGGDRICSSQVELQWRAQSLRSPAVSCQTAVTGSIAVQVEPRWRAQSLQSLVVSRWTPGTCFAEMQR